jgi:hypothetical protein
LRLGPLHHRDHLGLLIAAFDIRALSRRVAPLALGRGLLRPPFPGRHVGRLWRNVGGQTLDGVVNSRDGDLAACKLLDRLQIVERSDARKAVPRIH